MTSWGTSRYRTARAWAVIVVYLLVLALVVLEGARTAGAATSPDRPAIICKVFGPVHCADALVVSWCESRWSTRARNGQYLGMFQMGGWERRHYGHGPTALEQSRAAYRYFVASGRDWSPWSCQP